MKKHKGYHKVEHHWKGGGYDGRPHPEYNTNMCKELEDYLAAGRGIEYFMAANSISMKTFYNWLKRYPEFGQAYDIAKMKAKKYMMNLLHDNMFEEEEGMKLNYKIWSAIMKYSHNYADERQINIENLSEKDSSAEQIDMIVKEVASGDITPDEGKKLAEILEIATRIKEVSNLTIKLEQIENAIKIGVSDSDMVNESEADSSLSASSQE